MDKISETMKQLGKAYWDRHDKLLYDALAASQTQPAAAALPKFKVGDRVKYLDPNYGEGSLIGTVLKIVSEGCYEVTWEPVVHTGWYTQNELTLVATASQAPPPQGGRSGSAGLDANGTVLTWDNAVTDEVFIGIEDEMSDSAPLRGKCECGSEKAGSDRHSDWCPKFLFQENTNE